MEIKKILSKVCQTAATIYKNGWQETRSKAFKAAWLIVKLFDGQEVTFSFFSKSSGKVKGYTGSFATLDTLPKGYIRFSALIKSKIQGVGTEIAPKSFRVENLFV